MPPPDVTVVVMSRDRRAELVAGLGRHEAPVVLVDNGSVDGTADAVRQAHPRVRVVRVESNIGAAARTLGARLAETEFVAFADDDSWWGQGCLAAGAEVLRRHPAVALVNARILVGPEERLDPVCEQMARSPLGPADGGAGPSLVGFVACAAMARRSAFLDAGGFDDVVGFPGEEERVALDLLAAGWLLCYVDDLVVHHHPSPRRDDPGRRRSGIVRSRVLTAAMRRPWGAVVGEIGRGLAGGAAGARGVAGTVPRLPAALRAREPVPRHVEEALRCVAGDTPVPQP